MRLLFSYLTPLLFLATLSPAFVIPRNYTTQTPSSHVVYEFPNLAWIENIAVRSNGDLLITTLSISSLFTLSPSSSSSSSTPQLIHNFAPFDSVLGITEVHPDHFYVIAGNATTLNSFSVWSVDLSSPTSPATIKEITAIPQAGLLNGMTTLSVSQNLVILADSANGLIWWLNVVTGHYSTLLNATEFQPVVVDGEISVGINGLKVLPCSSSSDDDGEEGGEEIVWVYFDNTSKKLLGRVKISVSTLQPLGSIEILETTYGPDDFALDEEAGFVYFADGPLNSVLRIPLGGGEVETVIGGENSTVLPGPTSVAVGRGVSEKGWIFITTNGGYQNPVNGTYVEGGKVLAVDVGTWS